LNENKQKNNLTLFGVEVVGLDSSHLSRSRGRKRYDR